jgi:hypothetical protein
VSSVLQPLTGGCNRRRRRGLGHPSAATAARRDLAAPTHSPSPPGVFAACDVTDVISRYTVLVNATFSCYVNMYAGSCAGSQCPALSHDMRCNMTACFGDDWFNCSAALRTTDGLVGRMSSDNWDAGALYSFQGASECGPSEQVGDHGCRWKVDTVVETVPVCCVDIRSTSTILDSFDVCPAANATNSATHSPDGPCVSTSTTTSTMSTTAPPSAQPTTQPTLTLTQRPTTTPSPTRRPTVRRTAAPLAVAAGGSNSPQTRVSTGDDATIGIAAAVVIAGGVLVAAFWVWRPTTFDTTPVYQEVSTRPNAVYDMASPVDYASA